ncbi:MAG: bifunctional acetate--CoA ligase family protein/GNAT family N-acetyltransferase [Burkholderiaceae bacterium]|nr:bifunctional acetate--CoA ligase family protein/GNAT family N-acetyltransferase [Burkholderiaceae bacterium]
MTIRNLVHLFKPKSVAVIGASNRQPSIGAKVIENMLAGGFQGVILPVNPKQKSIASVHAYASIADLPETPELAVICTPPETIPTLITELGERGTKAVIVITAGLSQAKDQHGHTIKDAMLEAAKPHLLRILGPNCVGLLVPGIGLNASFSHTDALNGNLAFVSQSGALTTVVLDWAKSKEIGFSHFISLGDIADVDFGDILDYLATDDDTSAILLYVESIHAARKFLSAARSTARIKPVLIIKAGRAPEGAQAAASHTGALAGADDVYDAAIRRAGMLRVNTTEELFDAVETLARARPLDNDRLTIITNGGGCGVMATDALILANGKLAQISRETVAKLDAVLPATWSHGNPIDIIGDAPIERYLDTLKILLDAPETGTILFLHAPTAIVPSQEIAAALANLFKHSTRNIFGCWMGGDSLEQARTIFRQAGIPTFDTPEQAVRGFRQVVEYNCNQEMLMQTPPSAPEEFMPDSEKAAAIVYAALASGRNMLTEPEAKDVFAAYGIPIVETRVAATPEEAIKVASKIGFPVAVKILSPDITHKSEVGGVALDLETAQQVEIAAKGMLLRMKKIRPDAVLTGFSVQKMARKPKAFELIIGATTDPIFGPVVLFGHGGTEVEVVDDSVVGLPPLNLALAKDMVMRTRIAKLLVGYRNVPATRIEEICLTLTKVSQLICDIPEIIELDINPLLADEDGVLALDARIGVALATSSGTERLAIRPYPKELEEAIFWNGQPLLLRPIKPEDELQHADFIKALAPEDYRKRFRPKARQVPHPQRSRSVLIDYDREMAFVAVSKDANGQPQTLGVVRAYADPDNIRAEFVIVVRSDLKRKGLGTILMNRIIAYCQSRGTAELVNLAPRDNIEMMGFAKRFGCSMKNNKANRMTEVRLALSGHATHAPHKHTTQESRNNLNGKHANFKPEKKHH